MKFCLFGLSLALMLICVPAVAIQQPQPPFIFVKPVFTTPQITQVTNKYIVIDNAGQKSFLDVAFGKPVEANDYSGERTSDYSTVLPGNDGKYRHAKYTQTPDGDGYLSLGWSTFMVSKDMFCQFENTDSANTLMTVWDAKTKKPVWDFKFQNAGEFYPGKFAVIKDLLLLTIHGSTLFFDIHTGKVCFVTKPFFLQRIWQWKNFALIGNLLIDTDKLVIVHDFNTESLMADAGKIYDFSQPRNGDIKRIVCYDIETAKFTSFELEEPLSKNGIISYTRGVCNGLFMVWNAKTDSSDIVDPIEGKILFSHPNTATHRINWGFFHNGSQIVFFDDAQITCFDSVKREVLWEKEFITATNSLGDNYFWQPTIDPSVVKVFNVGDLDKCVFVKVNPMSHLTNVYPDDDCVFSVKTEGIENKTVIERYDWDGKVSLLPDIAEFATAVLHAFSGLGKTYIWTMQEESSTLFRLEGLSWIQVFQTNHTGYPRADHSQNLFAVMADDTHIKIFDFLDGQSKIVETGKIWRLAFHGGYLLSQIGKTNYLINPQTGKILDSNAGKFAGAEDGLLYMLKGNALVTWKNDQPIQTILEFDFTDQIDKISASGGMLLADFKLFDREGRFCQLIPTSLYGSKLVRIKNQTFLLKESRGKSDLIRLNESGRHSLSLKTGKMVITNTGKVKLTGRCWIVPANDISSQKLENAITFEVEPGKPISIDASDYSEFFFVIQTNGHLERDSLETPNQIKGLPSWLGNLSENQDFITNITCWKK
jgi:hypothetical protein